MRTTGYQSYFKDELVDADPLKLIHLLYRGALDSIVTARRYLRLGDISARSQAISKAMAIVTELAISLNAEQGGEVSRNLARLYAYVEKLLIQANFEQRDKPLEEAERLLSTLAEAWTAILPPEPVRVPQTPVPGETYQPVSCAY